MSSDKIANVIIIIGGIVAMGITADHMRVLDDLVRTESEDEIDNKPLHSADEEYVLASKIAMGKSADAILNDKEKSELLSEQEKRTFRDISELGVMARKRMIETKLSLVVSITKRYGQHNHNFLNLIQEGSIALIKAVDSFDWNKGDKFSIYATQCIRQAVTCAIADQAKTCPDQRNEIIEKSIDEIISDINVSDPEQEKERILKREVLEEVWGGLTDRDRTIICLCYGFDYDCTHPIEENIQRIAVPRERVRQIELMIARRMIVSLKRRKLI